jgi:pyruvate/2-oxoglutarate dehydrogenase complex dihydrolipoamide dehydrogenase (E3) component
MAEEFDAIIIGSGQAGPFLGARLADAGQKVALIEREHLGGTCVNDGCTPTKTLVASARVAHQARRAADFGIVLPGPVSVDMKSVMARKDAVVQASVRSLTSWLGGMANMTVIFGDAHFIAPKTVAVGDRVLRADKVFINTGGRAVVPNWPGLGGVPWLTNTTILQLTVLPRHLIVIGGSYVGLEFAQMFRRFGAEVTVVEAHDIVGHEDDDVRAALRDLLHDEGITVHTGVRDIVVSGAGTEIGVHAESANGPIELAGSHLLLAVGRRPNTDMLNLEAAGIATDARGFITTDPFLRTSADGVWALGDVNGRGAFTHTSYNDYEIVAANLLDGASRRATDRIPAYALFTDPPLARIGMSETQVRASGRPALRGFRPMERVARARERGETRGFMKVLVDAETHRILGATLFGIEADEVIHCLLDVMAADAPYTVIRDCVHIHPTVSELIPTLLGDLHPLAAA